jgi:Mrp family chromosome partitioning ATPase
VKAERQSEVADPNVLTSTWDHRLLIVLFVGVFAALGVLIASMRPSEYAAEAGALLKDPQLTALSDIRSANDESRYVADQVAIMKSVAVSERASALAQASRNPKTIDARDLQRNTSIRSSEGSNFIVVRFRAGDPETAAAGANAVVRAYRELIRADLDADIRAALQRLDVSINAVARIISSSPSTGASGSNDDALALLRELKSQRNRLQVDAELIGDGVALFSPAGRGKPQGVSLVSTLAIAMILGGLIGVGLAYVLDARKQAFSSRFEPQILVDAPALAEIPDFTREGISSKLPVLDAPGTESAEAFRFLAAGISLPSSIALVSASFGDGTTTLAANTALAAAQEGLRVLALDADLEGGLTQLLLGDGVRTTDGAHGTSVGLTDMLVQGGSAESIQRVIETSAGGTLSLLGLGTATVDAMSVFRSEQILAALTDEFDRVLIDVPPILHVAYADALVRIAGAVVVVVPHESKAARLKHVLDRLDLLGVRPIGYIYNFAPSRAETRGRGLSRATAPARWRRHSRAAA